MASWKQGRGPILATAGLALGLFAIRADDRPIASRAGKPMPDFTLRSADGKPVRLYGFAGKAGAVLIFTGVSCPNSNKSLPRLAELSRAYGPKGIVFLGINSNAGEGPAEVAAHAREHDLPFPILKDPANVVADLALVERTCEVVVLDDRAVVRYRGAIDDQHGQGASRPAPTRHYLADALDAILARRPVELSSTKAIGCPIERVEKVPAARVRPAAPEIVRAGLEREQQDGPIRVGPVDYASDVAPILQRKCQSCHRPGQVGPFPLLGYDDARNHRTVIAEVVEDRRMPPWHADPRHGRFANDRSLTPVERATVLAWVEQGSPLGDPSRLPPPRTFVEGWSIGVPDQVFEIPKANDVPAVGVLDYVIVDVPTHFDRDMWIQAAEVRPEVRSIVHHIIVYVEPPGAGPKDHREHLAAYVPGDIPTSYPDGIAKQVPAGSKLQFGIHYTPDGKPHADLTRLGLVYAKGPVRHRAYTRPIQNTSFAIPARDRNHEVRSSQTFRSSIQIHSLSPHMHVRGKDFRYTATYPDGRSELLLTVPAYDFGWQSVYVLAEPKAIPKGTRIDCVAHFDNSANNPANPDPDQVVRWGEQSTSEMMMGYYDAIEDAPSGWKPRPPVPRGRAAR